MSGHEAWNRNVFKRWRTVDRDGPDITLSGRLFQMVGPATEKARPPTVDSFTDGEGMQAMRPKNHGRRLSTATTAAVISWDALGTQIKKSLQADISLQHRTAMPIFPGPLHITAVESLLSR